MLAARFSSLSSAKRAMCAAPGRTRAPRGSRTALLQVAGDRRDLLARQPVGVRRGDPERRRRPSASTGSARNVSSARWRSSTNRITTTPISVSAGLEQRRHPVLDELVERLDVVGQARDEHAGPVARVEADRQLLQVREQLHRRSCSARWPTQSDQIGLAARWRSRRSPRDARNATTIRSSAPTSWCGCRRRSPSLARGGGASAAAVATTSDDEHRRDAPAVRRAAGRAGRAACARAPPVWRDAAADVAPWPRSQARRLALARLARRGTPGRACPSRRSRGTASELVQQLVVGALCGDPAVLEHDDLVGQRDRRQPVGDHERGPVRSSASRSASLICCSVEASTDEVASSRIRMRGSASDRARDRDPLALSAGERQPALADQRVVALGQVAR